MKLTFDKETHKQVNHWDKMFNLKLYCDDSAKGIRSIKFYN